MARHLALITRTSGTAGWIAVALLLATSSSASPAAERLVIRTYNSVRVAPEEMVTARIAAASILMHARIQPVWRDCPAGCDEALGPREVVLRIVAAPKDTMPELLGCSVVDVQARTGTLATVYADHIESVAHRAGADMGKVLGRAIAHEIGHLLLGTSVHSTSGLMRARWSDFELQRDLASDWTLSPDEMARLGRGLIARGSRPPAPAGPVVLNTGATITAAVEGPKPQ